MDQTRPLIYLYALLLLLAGCGGDDGPSRMPVFGGVQVNGVPVTKGTISLLPAPGSSGPSATTVIEDGKYEFTDETGPCPGAHRVIIDIDPEATATDPTVAPGVQGIKVAPVVQQPKKKAVGPPPTKLHWELDYSVPEESSEAKDFTLTE